MITKEKYSKWLNDELAGHGLEVPKKVCDAIGKKLSNPAAIWASSLEKSASPPPSGKIVEAHLFLGIALVEDSGEYGPTAEEFAYDITRGDIIGDFLSLGPVRLKKHQIIPALLEIGNDGTYFGDD